MRITAAPSNSSSAHQVQRRIAALLCVLFASVFGSLIWLQGRMSAQPVARRIQQQECKGKEHVLNLLQTAVSHSIDPTKCQVPSLFTAVRNQKSRKTSKQKHRRNKKLPPLVYNQTTCELTDLCPQFPKWKQVVQAYGKDPVILGMETCPSYRKLLQSKKNGVTRPNATVRVAGLYNSGTNALAAALQDNLPHLNSAAAAGASMNWDVPWGKHVPLNYRQQKISPGSSTTSTTAIEQILPIVVVRDPFRWMQAMCKASYDAEWTLAPNQHCPNLVPISKDFATPLRHSKKANRTSYKVQVPLHQAGYEKTDHYDSLAHMWTAWHKQYLKTDIPRLMVRFEDFLFHREQVLAQISECATGQKLRGGDAPKQQALQYRIASVKDHGQSSDLVSAVIRYGSSRGRYAGMDKEDLRFAAKALDAKLMQKLHYLKVPTV